MKATALTTEYMINPLGLGIRTPRLFWNCADGIAQTAYQIIATGEAGDTLWDTSRREGGTMHADWAEQSLSSRSRVFWRVRLWDENGDAGEWSEQAVFELGLLDSSDWTARWIAGNYRVNKRKRYPVDCFKKEFTAGRVVKARLYASACGLYEAELNGARVGDFVLAPGVTDYRKRVQYQVYDVTDLIIEGQNTITLMLADGWYCGSVGAWGLKNQYGTQTKVIAQLELTMADGSTQIVGTGRDWRWSNDGSIRFADNKDGEIYDASMQPTYSRRAKKAACAAPLTASDNVPVTERERLSARLIVSPSGKRILDFGQNIAGYLSFSVNAKRGQRVFLRFGELIGEDGEFTQSNIQCAHKERRTPLQQVEYLCRDGLCEYKTRFAIFGFRYVLVESDIDLPSEAFTAFAVYSAMPETARFECSNELLGRFVECTRWSTKGNSADLPTDCPTRERHGWTGDAQIFLDTASYLFGYAPFARKYQRDVTDAQRRDGRFTQIVPVGGTDFYMKGMDGSVGWADVGVMLPYRIWKQYGDERILAENYEAMCRYARFMERRCGREYLTGRRLRLRGEEKRYSVNCGQCYGEWAEPTDVHAMTWKDCAVPHPEVQTAYTSYVMSLMTEIAQRLGRTGDAKEFGLYAAKTRASYQAMRRLSRFPLDTDRQAELVRPLYFGLLDEEQTEYAKQRLIKALENYGWRLGTGFLSTPLILYVLADIDIESAYRLLENEEMPGWLFMPRMGATTVWESWEGTEAQSGIASLNHYSKGAVCEWLFRVMCGVSVAGENHFIIAPRPGGRLTFARLEYDSVYGTVASGWRRGEGATEFTVCVPAGCTADVRLPDGTRQSVGAGEYRFTVSGSIKGAE